MASASDVSLDRRVRNHCGLCRIYILLRRPPGCDTDRAPRLPDRLKHGVRLSPWTCESNCEQQGAAYDHEYGYRNEQLSFHCGILAVMMKGRYERALAVDRPSAPFVAQDAALRDRYDDFSLAPNRNFDRRFQLELAPVDFQLRLFEVRLRNVEREGQLFSSLARLLHAHHCFVSYRGALYL